jgi:hypothetical protein
METPQHTETITFNTQMATPRQSEPSGMESLGKVLAIIYHIQWQT